jgi:hypothetical protein
MITAHYINNLLSEEYEKICPLPYGNVRTKYTVFKNPSLKEIREVEKEYNEQEVRFIADNHTRSVYVWSSIAANHHDTRHCLDLHCSLKINSKYVCGSHLDGMAIRQGSMLHMTRSDMMDGFACDSDYREVIFFQDWTWVDKYIKVSSWIENLKDKFEWKERN